MWIEKALANPTSVSVKTSPANCEQGCGYSNWRHFKQSRYGCFFLHGLLLNLGLCVFCEDGYCMIQCFSLSREKLEWGKVLLSLPLLFPPAPLVSRNVSNQNIGFLQLSSLCDHKIICHCHNVFSPNNVPAFFKKNIDQIWVVKYWG